VKTTLKVKSSSIALDYIKEKGISKEMFDKCFDEDLKKITDKINSIVK
jgi:hypothetical protein